MSEHSVNQKGTVGYSESTEKFAQDTHKYIRDYIKYADQQAAFVIAYSTATLAFLHQNGGLKRVLNVLNTWAVGDLFLLTAVVGLGLAIIYAIAVLFPRTAMKAKITSYIGFIYWETIAQVYKNSFDYHSAISKLSPDDLIKAKLEHCYELAKVCTTKHSLLAISLKSGIVGFLAAVTCLFM